MKQRSITSFFSPKGAATKKPIISKEPLKDVSAKQLNAEPMEIIIDDNDDDDDVDPVMKKPVNTTQTASPVSSAGKGMSI